MSAQTLANCNVDPVADELAMIDCMDIPKSWLPANLQNSKKTRKASRVFKQMEEVSNISHNKRMNENAEYAKQNRLDGYAVQVQSGEIDYGKLSLSQEAAIDNNYIKCYADFVRLGIVEPISQDEIAEYEESLS